MAKRTVLLLGFYLIKGQVKLLQNSVNTLFTWSANGVGQIGFFAVDSKSSDDEE